MKCKNCKTQVDDNERYCPSCGEELELPKDLPAIDEEETQNDTFPTIDEEQDQPADSYYQEEAPATPKKKGLSASAILIAVLVLISLASIIIYVVNGTTDDGSKVIATMEDYKMTNKDLGFYYWNEVYFLDNYYSQYGMSIFSIVDPNIDFAEQECSIDGYATWHDFFLESAIDSWARTIVLSNLAKDSGQTLDAAQLEYLAAFEENIEADAVKYEFASAQDMLSEDFGSFADVGSYKSYLEGRYLASAYTYNQYNTILAKYTASLETCSSVNVRHILFLSAEDAEAAEAKAKAALAQWQTNPTEDYFAALATEQSEDTGSVENGGLCDTVAPGEMVEPFEEWCFDPARKVGDTGIVETTFGFHVMYFCGTNDDSVIKNPDDSTAAEETAYSEYQVWLEALQSGITYTTTPGNVVITKNAATLVQSN